MCPRFDWLSAWDSPTAEPCPRRGGTVRITAGLKPTGEDVAISVVATGRGIPAEDLPHVFNRRYKSADSTGSGPGLSIAPNLVVAHGGEITAESGPDKAPRFAPRCL
ncbi:MAG TPA: ATP-binding protein [Anaerolineales bacterium]|nr:ATP-binding protein [Anaerolineales bacterium]